uniref:methyltransferase domain-containing protein n=1 Tax=uncultured Caulobacter sp. TaxID=158749 RepID=UPI0025F9A263|nr:methyltransferase domain-containing protein [uncultured Caulobacter sp.]
MTTSPLLFDRALHRARLDRAAPDFAAADFLKARAAQDVVMRLETILRRFPVAVDLGARNGHFFKALEGSDARANIDTLIEADLSGRMLGGRETLRVVADEERLPFGDATLDLVTSTLSLHWTNDLVGALIQIRRALKPDGLFVGAIFGGATLTELRQCLLAAEAELSDGAAMRVSPFADAIDAAGLLQRAGFALPVADVDRVKVRYSHPLSLLQDLRRMGETSVLIDRSRKPLTKKVLFRAMELYVERFAEADGKVPVTFEIVSVTGWAPHDSQQKPLRPGSAKMRLADALGTTEESAGDKAG